MGMIRTRSRTRFPRDRRKSLPPCALDDMRNRLSLFWGKDDLKLFPAVARVHFEIQDAEPLLVAEAGVYQPCQREERRDVSEACEPEPVDPHFFFQERTSSRSVVRSAAAGTNSPPYEP